METEKIKSLLIGDDSLESNDQTPVNDILSYCNKAGTVAPEEALRYLAEMYIDNCGISTGFRSFADYCSVFWINQLKCKDGDKFFTKYNGAETLPELLTFFSDEYTEEIDKYDICFMSGTDIRDILIDEFNDTPDDEVKIILCAGICYCLSWLDD